MITLWQRNLHYSGTQSLETCLNSKDSGSLIVFWHNRLFLTIGALHRIQTRSRRIFALVSASRDGAVLSQFLMTQGIDSVRGSSSRRGALAARELVRIIADGNHVAITVDGPRGPCYRAHPGAAFLAELTETPLTLISAEAESAWSLNSWDRFILPKPFSRVRIQAHPWNPAKSPVNGQRPTRECFRMEIETRLRDLTWDAHLENKTG